MAALGDKISANILAQSAKVPSIPWSGDHITLDVKQRQQEAKGRYFICLRFMRSKLYRLS